MSAPPKPWEVQSSQPAQPVVTPTATAPATVPNATAQPSVIQPTASTQPPYSSYNSTGYRRPMYSSPMMRSAYGSPYSSMYRGGLGGLGGYGMGGMYGGYGGLGGMYGGMGGMYGGMGGYGMDYQSKGMMAIERFAILVNSLCFTAETIEHSMHSMKVFWEALQRIKAWGADGVKCVLSFVRKKLQYWTRWLLYLLGRSERPESEDMSVAKVLLNLLLVFVLYQIAKFCWREFTSPSIEEYPDVGYL